MIKSLKYIMGNIHDVEIYPIISLVIFVLFFAAVTVLVMRMKKEDINVLKNMPLTDKDK